MLVSGWRLRKRGNCELLRLFIEQEFESADVTAIEPIGLGLPPVMADLRLAGMPRVEWLGLNPSVQHHVVADGKTAYAWPEIVTELRGGCDV